MYIHTINHTLSLNGFAIHSPLHRHQLLYFTVTAHSSSLIHSLNLHQSSAYILYGRLVGPRVAVQAHEVEVGIGLTRATTLVPLLSVVGGASTAKTLELVRSSCGTGIVCDQCKDKPRLQCVLVTESLIPSR